MLLPNRASSCLPCLKRQNPRFGHVLMDRFQQWSSCLDAVSENATDDKKKELSNQLEEDGFLLHKDKGCEHGCNFCREFRRVTSWPDGIPLLKNPAAYQKPVLYQLCHHYNLKLEDLPEAGLSSHCFPSVFVCRLHSDSLLQHGFAQNHFDGAL